MNSNIHKILGGVLLVLCASVFCNKSASAAASASISGVSNIDILTTPSTTGDILVESTPIQVSVSNAMDYTLTISSDSPNLSGSSENVASTATGGALTTFANNTWGRCFASTACVASNVFNPINTTETTLVTKDVRDSSFAANDTYYLTYGMKINSSLSPDTYTNTQVISLIASDIFQVDFVYTGGEQTLTIPQSGRYRLEVWGAQGGTWDLSTIQYNVGGYSTGEISLSADTQLYINVGGVGTRANIVSVPGGYNGGGYGYRNGTSGGGATHIALVSGLLSTISSTANLLIVAGGGGGATAYTSGYTYAGSYNSAAGGMKGNDGGYANSYPRYRGSGGNQAQGGSDLSGEDGAKSGGYGRGGNGYSRNASFGGMGGGGGFYGGGGTCRLHAGGGGGSSWIKNSRLSNQYMVCRECYETNSTNQITLSTTNISEDAVSSQPKFGAGHARITYLGT